MPCSLPPLPRILGDPFPQLQQEPPLDERRFVWQPRPRCRRYALPDQVARCPICEQGLVVIYGPRGVPTWICGCGGPGALQALDRELGQVAVDVPREVLEDLDEEPEADRRCGGKPRLLF
jgi:hypothetical protein